MTNTFYAGKANYGYEFDEWPNDWSMEELKNRPIDRMRGSGLVPTDRHGDSGDDSGGTMLRRSSVGALKDLRYEPYETGVGCAEHDDPACLCDVHISEPVDISVSTRQYDWADVPGVPHGTYDWWCSILGRSDAYSTLEKLAQSRGGAGRIRSKFHEELDIVAYALDLGNYEGMRHAQVARKHGLSREQVEHQRRKLWKQEKAAGRR